MSDIPCLADGPWIGSYEDGCGSSCTLPEGHEGPHEWVSNRKIMVRLTPLGRAVGELLKSQEAPASAQQAAGE